MDVYLRFEVWMEARNLGLPTTAEDLRQRAERFAAQMRLSPRERRELMEAVEGQS